MRLKRGGWPYNHPPNTQFTLNTQSPQAQGLVNWWPTLGSRGNLTTLRDYRAGSDGTINGGDLWTSGEMGWALENTLSIAKYVDTGHIPDGNSSTYSVWVRPDVINVWQFSAGCVNGDNRIYLGISNAGKYSFGAGSIGPAPGTIDAVVGEWALVTLVLDGSDFYGYVNGQLARAGFAYVWGDTPVEWYLLANNLNGASRSSPLDGAIVDVRIYDRALSVAEIGAQYAAATRWELYRPVISSTLGLVPTEYKVFPSSLVSMDRAPIRVREFTAASEEYLEIDSAVVTAVPFTVSCWFNVNDVANTHVLFYVGDKGSATDRFFLAVGGADAGDPLVLFTQQGGANQKAETSNSVSADTWHHGAAIATDSTDRVTVLDGDWANRGTSITDITPAGLDRTSIGRGGDFTPGGYTDGSIAEMAVWNVALTQAEVKLLSLGISPLLIRRQNLVAYWPLQFGNSWDRDMVRNYHMTAFNTPAWAPGPSRVRKFVSKISKWLRLGMLLEEISTTWVSPANHVDIDSTPVLVFQSPTFTGNAHFNMELDKVNTFDGGDLRVLKTNVAQASWEYWDGDSWESFPAAGLSDAYSENNCRYTVASPLSAGMWYRRVRKG